MILFQDPVYQTNRPSVSFSEGTEGTANIAINGAKNVLAMSSMPNRIAEAVCKIKGFR